MTFNLIYSSFFYILKSILHSTVIYIYIFSLMYVEKRTSNRQQKKSKIRQSKKKKSYFCFIFKVLWYLRIPKYVCISCFFCFELWYDHPWHHLTIIIKKHLRFVKSYASKKNSIFFLLPVARPFFYIHKTKYLNIYDSTM